jgi:nitrogen fixation NifU-like protein
MDIYADNILDHFKNPRHLGTLSGPTISLDDANPLCGDKLALDLLIEDNRVKDITFSGSGCAISQAAMSMLTEEAYTKTLDDVEKISKEQIYQLLGVPISPARVKCALLGYTLLKKAIILLKAKKTE